MIFTKTIRVSSIFTGDSVDREVYYQQMKAYVALCRDLEHAGILKITDMPRTGDGVKKLITIEIPDVPHQESWRLVYQGGCHDVWCNTVNHKRTYGGYVFGEPEKPGEPMDGGREY